MKFLSCILRRSFIVSVTFAGLVSKVFASPISVAAVIVDPPTVCCIGLSLPIISGDTNYNAQVDVSFRRLGTSNWTPALPLLRVRPETLGNEDPPENFGLPRPGEQFAGSIFGLDAGTSYEVRLTITDPDGGSGQQSVSVMTQRLPVDSPSKMRQVQVSTTFDLNNAVANAEPGDVIELASGNYGGPVRVSRSGTRDDPIIIRGVDRDSVVIDGGGTTFGIEITGAYVYFEDMSVTNAEWGALASNTTGAVIRNVFFSNINKGIYAKSGANRDFYICDNVLEGNGAVWPDVSKATWGLEGITITGQGHTVCYNRLSGFGDSLGLSNETDIPNLAIDFFGNEILWGGDDGIELDFSHRNVRAFRNRITNSGMGVSTQPAWGGPVYIMRNVIVNTAHSPYKLNNDPSGILIFHNTSIRTVGAGNFQGSAWPQFGGVVANLSLVNNISIGVSGPNVTSDIVLGEIDYNGWFPDGQFTFFNSWADFQTMQQNSAFEANGRILTSAIFQDAIQLGQDYTSLVLPVDVTLNSTSNALDIGRVLPNINDDFFGSGVDIGARERGAPAPVYGPRVNQESQDPSRPAAPTNLIVQ